ncbi:MAG: glycosyltransferase [Gemmatimonas sp.]|uniref:glycosyltransferase family 2 protein n=3 Tax=Gemmatimonas sp. TaxID=1962908 RepID=UPI00391FC6FA|nr:glycosyltransferase [Gemmatimonadota bacterium]
MLYLAIPAHNEVATIGVLLWRLRTVLAEFPREYEVVVYDDASTDETAAVAEQYERAMPVTVRRGTTHLGYAGAVNALLTHVAGLTRYPRRDAVLLLQGDFTDPPGMVPEFARRFEGGADLVVGERMVVADAPTAVRRLFTGAQWAMRPFVRVEGVRDMTASMRLVRISALREALRTAGSEPFVRGDSWTANADLLLRLVPHARRVESVPLEPTYGVRMRETRRVAMRDALSALKWAWGARGRRAVAGSAPDATAEPERKGPRSGGRRREETEPLSVERIREKVRDRDGSRGLEGDPSDARRDRERRRGREREREAREPQEPRERLASAKESPERLPRGERPPRAERGRERDGTRSAEPKGSRSESRGAERRSGAPRPAPRRDQPRSPSADASMQLDDPFAAPAPKRDPFSRVLGSMASSRPSADATEGPPADAGAVEETAEAPVPETVPRPPRAKANAVLPRDESEGSAGVDVVEHAGGLSGPEDEAEAESLPEAEGEAGVERPTKRRRNRRSRRGRRKREGTAGEGPASESEQDGTEGESTEQAAAVTVPAPRLRDPFGEHIDGEPVAFESVGDDDRDDDGDDDRDHDVAGSDSMADGAPRSRRRGRRGRRGGARRSRGRRDRERDGDSGDSSAADRTDAVD